MLGAEAGKMDKAVLMLKVLTTWLCKTLAFSKCNFSIRR